MEERPSTAWLLRSLMAGGDRVWNVSVITLPFRVGRRPGLELTLPSTSVSMQHAEFYERDRELRVRDLGSTNGTYVNRRRVTDEGLGDGDILHFADFEFRLELAPATTRETTTALRDIALPEQFVKGTNELEELLRGNLVRADFQPIVAMDGGAVIGHEALGRGTHPALPQAPQALLHIADGIGRSVALSQLFRRRAVEVARGHPQVRRLFLNTHPREIVQPGLIGSLRDLREQAPDLEIVVEVHESTAVGSEGIREFRAGLRAMNIELAYDDFGAGQARLLELAEVPPEYLKFDMGFVLGIASAPEAKQRLVRSLVTIARELGVRSIAEGVETEADARACAQLGFELAQGFHFGDPVPVDRLGR
jgi:EAL domain-containing protein (putative c-di-GMP-specific phosphodiesterase class I)